LPAKIILAAYPLITLSLQVVRVLVVVAVVRVVCAAQ
jgi:hypothetical protein